MDSVMKFTWLLMLLCLSSVWLQAPQDQDGNATAENITAVLKTQKDIMVSTAGTASTTDHKYGLSGGRKMALDTMMKPAKVQAQGVSRSNNSKKVSAGSTNKVEENFGRKKKSWGDQKMTFKQTIGPYSAKIDETAGFVAFNADYRAPRHHPPKNN